MSLNLLQEWEYRRELLKKIAAHFTSDAVARAYADGARCATWRCEQDLRANGEWIKGYEAGLRAFLKTHVVMERRTGQPPEGT